MFNSAAIFVEKRCSSQLDIPRSWLSSETDDEVFLPTKKKYTTQPKHKHHRYQQQQCRYSLPADSRNKLYLQKVVAGGPISIVSSSCSSSGEIVVKAAAASSPAIIPSSSISPYVKDLETHQQQQQQEHSRSVDGLSYPISEIGGINDVTPLYHSTNEFPILDSLNLVAQSNNNVNININKNKKKDEKEKLVSHDKHSHHHSHHHHKRNLLDEVLESLKLQQHGSGFVGNTY